MIYSSKPGSKMLKYCFSYDAEGKGYVFNITKVGGSAIIFFALVLFLFLAFAGRKTKNRVLPSQLQQNQPIIHVGRCNELFASDSPRSRPGKRPSNPLNTTFTFPPLRLVRKIIDSRPTDHLILESATNSSRLNLFQPISSAGARATALSNPPFWSSI